MDMEHKFTVHYLRTYFHCEKQLYSTSDRNLAEEQCFDEYGDLDDMSIISVTEQNNGHLIEYGYWEEQIPEQAIINAFSLEDAKYLFEQMFSDPNEENLIENIIDEGPDGHAYMQRLEKLGQLTFNFEESLTT